MFDTTVTLFQLFGIGFSFSLYGPCLTSCIPVLLFFLGMHNSPRKIIINVLIFLTGRICAYAFLGYLAGMSAHYLQQFSGDQRLIFLKPIGGFLLIILGLVIIFKNPQKGYCVQVLNQHSSVTFFTLFSLGLLVGISPCPPLLALLFEIVLIAKNGWQGLMYALAFGLGTFISGFILLGVLGNIFGSFLKKIASPKYTLIYRVLCAVFLIIFGALIIAHSFT